MTAIKQHFDSAREALEKAGTVLLTTHERTDGDDLGSVLAMAHHLQSSGKNIHVVVKGGVPEQLRYLPGSDIVTEIFPEGKIDVAVISGCSNISRVGLPELENLNATIINIDHHPDNSLYADINVVDAAKSAVAELTFDFFEHTGWPITSAIATCLLTGIITDTGVFMHSNTKDTTLNAAANLMRKGARISTITKHTYQGKNIEGLKAWSKALENAQYDPAQRMIYTILTEEELSDMGNPPLEYFEGIVETLNKVPEARFALFLKQDQNMIKGSLRSDPHKGVNVKEIAHLFGGGGHKWAAGFSVVGKLEKTDQGRWQVI
jgi:bifunctional oligoribonuclease and PAP phosphatase NrnA